MTEIIDEFFYKHKKEYFQAFLSAPTYNKREDLSKCYTGSLMNEVLYYIALGNDENAIEEIRDYCKFLIDKLLEEASNVNVYSEIYFE